MSGPPGAFDTGARRAGTPQGRASSRGLRRAARRRRRRRRLLLGISILLSGAALTAGPALVLHVMDTRQAADAAPEEADDAEVAANGSQSRLLLLTIDEASGSATSVTLLAGSDGEGPASALFLPTTTLVSTPGFGLDQLGAAHRYGGADLVRATVENALSVRVHEIATVTEEAFGEFLDRAGDLGIELAQRVVERHEDGSASVLFERGAHVMSGPELARLWLHGSVGDDELQAFQRRRLVLEGVLGAAGDPRVRDRLVADGAPQLRTEAEPGWLRDLVASLAAAQAEDRVRYNLLPVERFGTVGPDGRRAYRIHEEDAARLARTLLGGAEEVDTSGAVRAQVLNGVGSPGIGQLVDRLLPDDVRLVMTDNANRFDYAETRLIIYEETSEAVEAARLVQERLGVGTIQVSRQPQSMVDLTIVVGADLVKAAGSSENPEEGSESAD